MLDLAPVPKSALELNDKEKRALAKNKKWKLVKAATKTSSAPSASYTKPPQNIISEPVQPPTSQSLKNDATLDKRKKPKEPTYERPSKIPRTEITNLRPTDPARKLTPPPKISDSPSASDPK